MRERGGPPVQSGIIYQNSIAALYLGRLCDTRSRPDYERVAKVRVEAPEEVDDIVVTFADDHRAYVHAKENIRRNHEGWTKLWRDFAAQFQKESFQRGKDRLTLRIGEVHNEHHQLAGLCARANADNHIEWWNRLTGPQQDIAEKIKSLLDVELLNEPDLLAFFGHIDVEIVSLEQIERDQVTYWMPESNRLPMTLFRLLRDRVGGHARRRESFDSAASLRDSLKADGVNLKDAPDIENLRTAVRECGALLRQQKSTIANTGKHLKRSVVDEIVKWAQEVSSDERVAMLLDNAGLGKTVVARDVLCALDEMGITTLAIKADQQLSGIDTFGDLQTKLRLPDSPEQVAGRLATVSQVIVIIDQLDALSLSLARDQRALDIVLDLIARLRLIPGISILISCRTFDRNSEPRLRRIEIGKQFHVSELSDEEVREILRYLGLDFSALSPATQELLRLPLHLDLFALAIEGRVDEGIALGVSSLQELYALLWSNVILKPDSDAPPTFEREGVIRLITNRMDEEQRTSVPQSMFTLPDTRHLERAVKWLASEGILIAGATEWSLLHQTFFDYCYAKYFVEGGGVLTETILADQGLLARPRLVHVLSYLRATNSSAYLRELQSLFAAEALRFHLRDLLFRWFGALLSPTDDEWVVARRLLASSPSRTRLLNGLQGNPGWFARFDGRPIQELLSQDDQTLDTEIIPYLASMLNSAQAKVIQLVRPYKGSSDQWDNRLIWLLRRIHTWHALEAVELFEEMLCRIPTFTVDQIYELNDIAKGYPEAGCRLIRTVFDRELDQYLSKQDQHSNPYPHSFCSQLESLNGSTIDRALKTLSEAEPKLFLDSMLPWLDKVFGLSNEPTEDWPHYSIDELSYGSSWSSYVVQHQLIQSFTAALIKLAQTEPEAFRQAANYLAALPYQTPQHLLVHVYKAVAEMYAEDALEFLLADQRRLNLGDRQQYASRQLIEGVYPFLSGSGRIELENHILSYTSIWKHWGLDGLRWRGLEQLFLLQSLPADELTERGLRFLQELERKFPGVKASEKTVSRENGIVGPPISEQSARKMSDNAWLGAIQKYQGSVEHKDFYKGGSAELAALLRRLIKEDPGRFLGLIERAPDSVDICYIEAFINGLDESDAPADWLFDVVRRFAPRHNIKRMVAWALEKRVGTGLPNDLIDLLESYVRDTSIELEESDRDPYARYLNSDRGSSFKTLMRALDQLGAEEDTRRKWELIEFVATDPSTSLRAGAIEELLYVLHIDRERAITMFERLMDGHPNLLQSQFTHRFLNHGIYKYYSRVRPFICSLMDEDAERGQQTGAELACIAMISPKAMSSVEEQIQAKELARQALSGPPAWRRGAAQVYARNFAGKSSPVAVQELSKLLNDEDAEVQRLVSRLFNSLRGEHIFKMRPFIEAYAASRSLNSSRDELAKYLFENGLLDIDWTLAIIAIILNNQHGAEKSPRSLGSEELIRITLRIYTDPTSGVLARTQAMDLFDRLMERSAFEAHKVLREWDRL